MVAKRRAQGTEWGRDMVLEGEQLDVAPMSLSCGVCKCLCEPFPTLLRLLCFLQTCFIAKGPYITCRLLHYFCSLTLYTNLLFPHFMDLFFFFLLYSESLHDPPWHFIAIGWLISSAFLFPLPWMLMPHFPLLLHQGLDSCRSYPRSFPVPQTEMWLLMSQ